MRRWIRLLLLAALPAMPGCGGGDAPPASAVSAVQNRNLPQAQPDEAAETNGAVIVSTAVTLL